MTNLGRMNMVLLHDFYFIIFPGGGEKYRLLLPATRVTVVQLVKSTRGLKKKKKQKKKSRNQGTTVVFRVSPRKQYAFKLHVYACTKTGNSVSILITTRQNDESQSSMYKMVNRVLFSFFFFSPYRLT